jgi:hypothetical protein
MNVREMLTAGIEKATDKAVRQVKGSKEKERLSDLIRQAIMSESTIYETGDMVNLEDDNWNGEDESERLKYEITDIHIQVGGDGVTILYVVDGDEDNMIGEDEIEGRAD